MIEPVNNEQEISESQMRWQKQAEDLVRKNGLSFDEFIKTKPEMSNLIKEGNELISMGKTTGYNLISSPEQMELMSAKKLIFVNTYASEAIGVGKLLASFENSRLITKDQAKLGIKASKVIYDGWQKSENETIEDLFREPNENTYNPIISKTTEIVVTFIPADGDHANKILGHLVDFSQWQYPDLRATISLFENLSKTEFPTVQANLLPGKMAIS